MDSIALMVSNLSVLGGTERVTAILSKELSKFYKCSIITFYRDKELAYEIDPSIEIFNLYNQKYRLRKVWRDSILKISQYIKTRNIHILIVVGRNNGLLPLLLKPFCDAKIVYCEHNSINLHHFYHYNFSQETYRRVLQYLINNYADMVVTLTNNDLEYYKTRNIKSCAIPNFIDEKLIHGNEHCYNSESKKIITVARIDYQKGIEYLLDVANIVLKKHPDWEWHVFGGCNDESYKKKIETLWHKYNLEQNVLLMGANNNIYDVYKDYSFFVLTSRFEGFGMVLLEAKSNNLPTISFDIESGPADIIRDKVDGYLIPPFDIVTMSEKIEHLINNEDTRLYFSKNARGNLNEFSKERIIKQWRNLLDGLLISNEGGNL